MRLATFKTDPGAAPELGAVVASERIAPLSRGGAPIARDMIDLIARWPALKDTARRCAEAGEGARPLASVTLLAPIPRPGKIMAIGLNYADHIAESNAKPPEHQTWFSKATTAATGPFAPVEIPRASAAVDYEAELVVVIGPGGRNLAGEAARRAVFGFCCGNDVSVRDWQMRTGQWVIGKSFDTHAPFGPWITTADEVDPHTLGIRCLVNGETRQDSNTRHLVFDVWAEIEHLSQAMTLEPGDLIFTGTPAGVGASMRPPKFLKAGDVVRVEIDGLGAIENRCEAQA
jgi:2-keto-4-pentenoate hydratase/2-oxohepta-3-ene-1,7-dioic acid hydratase in catechol pathway